jgi:hypothetical protein
MASTGSDTVSPEGGRFVDDDAPDATHPEPEDDTPPSGVAAADEARARLDAVRDAPLEQHVEVYEDVHRRLQEGLADLDEG